MLRREYRPPRPVECDIELLIVSVRFVLKRIMGVDADREDRRISELIDEICRDQEEEEQGS